MNELKLYKDSGATQQVLATQIFSGTGSAHDFTLTNFPGSDLAGVYLELTTGVFTPQVPTDFTITGDVIHFITAPGSSINILAVPNSVVNLLFGGNESDTVTAVGHQWHKRDAGWIFDTLRLTSYDLRVPFAELEQAGVTVAAGVAIGFLGLTPSALVGRAFDHLGAYVGQITANDATTITTNNSGYTNATSGNGNAYTIAIDGSNNPIFLYSLNGTDWSPVVNPATITDDSIVETYIKGTLVIPASPANIPCYVSRLSGVKYVETSV